MSFRNTPCQTHTGRCIVGPGTLKFKTVPMDIPEEAGDQAKHALCPASAVTKKRTFTHGVETSASRGRVHFILV